jgi:hypothetical protein
MKCPALSATTGIALCLASLPAVALVSVGTRPTIFEQKFRAISDLNRGLPIMTLQSISLLRPQTLPASASVADHASREPTAVPVGN